MQQSSESLVLTSQCGQGMIPRTTRRTSSTTKPGTTHRLNIALVVLSLHMCFTDVMNSFPTQKKKKKKNPEQAICSES